MTFTVHTKFDIGDEVYIAQSYYEYCASSKPYIIKRVRIQSDGSVTHIVYNVEQNGVEDSVVEGLVFATYAECTKWCKNHN